MRKYNSNFSYYKVYSVLTLTAIVVFLALFAKSMLTAAEAFETGIYTNSIAEVNKVNIPN